jgi:hypothetical protein
MHSAYGLAFVLLFLVAGAMVVAGVVRGTLPRAVLAAIAGVPIFLVVFAVPFQYDPQRMRFFAFAAALAASTFGIALRVRVLAWSAVGLTGVTLLVLVGYFVPRPAGVAVLSGNRDSARGARWLVQSESNHWSADAEAFRFLEENVPPDSRLALAVVRDTAVYPVWNAGLDQHVEFVRADDAIPSDAEWLVVGPRDDFDAGSLPPPELETEGGWRIYRLRPSS